MNQFLEVAKRPFHTIPILASTQTGITIVTILFGLVISQLALDFASQIADVVNGIPFETDSSLGTQVSDVPIGWRAALADRNLAFLHLFVAATLTITSAIGYFTSRNLPRLRIQFFNKAFAQFSLDVSMVFTYYLVIEFTESNPHDKSAIPETLLVFVAFCLYIIWDYFSLLTSRNALDQLALRQMPREHVSMGPRRLDTIYFTIFIAIIASIAILLSIYDQTNDGIIIGLDIVLIVLLVLYRVRKSFSYPDRLIRGLAQETTEDRVPYGCPLDRDDVQKTLPEVVYRNLSFIQCVSKSMQMPQSNLTNSATHVVDSQTELSVRIIIDALTSEGIFLPVLLTPDETGLTHNILVLELTDFGKAVASIKLS